MLIADVVDRLVAQDFTPPIRMSRNIPGGDEHNRKVVEKYKDRMPELVY